MYTYDLCGLFVFGNTLKFRYDSLLREGVLLLGVPFCHLGETFLPEEVVKNFCIPTVRGEEEKKVLNVSTLESSSKVIHRLIGQIGTEYDGQDGDGCVWLGGHVVNEKHKKGRITDRS